MPNFSVFNTNPDYLRTLIFGQDNTGTSRTVATNANGELLTVIMDGTLNNLNISGVTITAGTLTNLLNGTITTLLDGTISNVLGATITAGTLTNLLNGTITTLLDGTISNVLGATITAGTLTNLLNGTITTLLDGTISNVLGATITAGTLTNLLNGTITSVLGATITAGTLTNLLNGTITTLLDGTISNVLGATITAGTLSSVTSISQKSFQESETLNLTTADAYTAMAAVTTSVFGTYSFFVYNKGPGTNKVDARVEISANGTNWFDDVDTITGIAAGSVDVLVPVRFLKYTRLSYKSSAAGTPTTIDVYFNAQGT